MDILEELEHTVDPKKTRKIPKSFFIITTASVVILCIAGVLGAAHIDESYKERVFPGIHIGELNVGGMQRQELEKFLTDMNDKLSNEGLHFTLTGAGEDKKFTIFPVTQTETSDTDIMHIDVQKEANYIVSLGKKGTFFTRIFTYAKSSWLEPHLKLRFIAVDESSLMNALKQNVQILVQEPKNADITVVSRTPVQFQTTASAPGVIYNFSNVKDKLIESWSVLNVPDITVATESKTPDILDKDVPVLTQNINQVFAAGPLSIEYTNDSGEVQRWKISEDNIQKWLGLHVYEDHTAGLGLKKELVQDYVDMYVAPDVNVDAQDARFTIDESGKVQEFEGSHPGLKVDSEKTYLALDTIIRSRALNLPEATSTIQLVTAVDEPLVKTGEVNDLGITQALGTGTSNFKGSPANRIHNIKAAVKKLNGILIKPGEEFSAIAYTQPYTLEAGYLPEKVIKGDKIVPEIGGGLCQVGTTLFRMAMNSGMDITERRNHSLVVSYYNDPSNNLPGTDATIYDPAPDFKFKNDTGSYVLIQTSVNVEKGDLKFTLWGTKDGRKGSYTKPVVSRWIPTGPTRVIESTSLKPGVKECQHAFPGADTSFTYTREMSDGTVQNKVFESHYRPLPEICLVGVEKKPDCPEGTVCTSDTPEAGAAGIPVSDLLPVPKTP